VTLSRLGQVIGTAQVAANTPGVLRTLRLSVIGNLLRVSVDGVEVITAFEPSLLLGGSFSLHGLGLDAAGLVVEGVRVWGTQGLVEAPVVAAQSIMMPTPMVTRMPPAEGGIAPLSITTSSYAVVENATELLSAIAVGNNRPAGSTYRIFMKAGTYTVTLSEPQRIEGNIEIYGLGSEVTVLDSNVDDKSLFVVPSWASLRLQDLTLTGADISPPSAATAAYGGIVFNEGVTEIYNVVLRNNFAANGGGAILNNGGTLTIDNSIFLSNTAGGGGAVQSSTTLDPSTTTISCSLFQSNNANYGGAVLNGQGPTTITNSVFNQNTVTIQPEFYGSAFFGVSGGTTNNLNGNYWPTWNGTIPLANSANPYTPGRDTISSNIVITSILTADPVGSPACPKPRPYTSVPTLAQELAFYGVTLAGNWTGPQLTAIVEALRDTAIALGVQSISNTSSTDDSPRETFRRVMTLARPNSTDSGIEFNYTGSTSTPYCITNKGASPLEARITCGGGFTITKYTLVHELGHVFVDRTSGSFYAQMESAVVRDANPNNAPPQSVFGSGFLDNNQLSDWRRGERGWGSPRAQIGRCDGSIPVPTPILAPTDFQQNPCDIVDSQYPVAQFGQLRITEIEEAAADMFLNWVYKAQGNGGFLNRDWTGCLPAGCDDSITGDYTGDTRMNWMNSTISSIFSNNQW
jgi:hypothetical protein